MKIFGWKSAGRGLLRPVSSRARLARGHNATASLGEWPRSYEAQVRDGYLNNAIAQRSVRLVAEGSASCVLRSNDPAVLALVKTTSAGQSLIETVAVHILLHGNAYVEIMTDSNGHPCELYALRPERMSVEADAQGWPMAYLYRVGTAAARLAAERVIHIRTMHPLDDHYGLGCLGAASGPVAIHNAASKWNKALLDNAARPSGALVYDGGDNSALSAVQYERLKAELQESFQGMGNAGRPMLLEGGLKWQTMSMTPADMDFAGLKSAAAREIAMAFGVPPMLLGLPGDATYANYQEANKALWRQTILPLTGKILDALSQGLQAAFPGASLSADLDQIPALSQDRERLWAQLVGADFLTTDEKREMAGFAALKAKAEAQIKPEVQTSGVLELKYNPWHDTQDGKFTSEGQGQRFGDGGTSGSHAAPKPQSSVPKKLSFRSGGGSFGGGGASGSWDTPKQKVPAARVQQPKRQIVKPPPFIPRPAVPKIKAPPRAAKPSIRKISAGGYNFEADTRDRTIHAHGQLRLEPAQRRSRSAQSNAGKPDRLPKDHGGHFIGRQFGGPETRYNHFAQNARFNNSDYRKLENEWKNQLKAGKKVKVDIRARYNGTSKRPDKVTVIYYVNGKFNEQSFPN